MRSIVDGIGKKKKWEFFDAMSFLYPSHKQQNATDDSQVSIFSTLLCLNK